MNLPLDKRVIPGLSAVIVLIGCSCQALGVSSAGQSTAVKPTQTASTAAAETATPAPSPAATETPMPAAVLKITTMAQDEVQPEPLVVLNRRIPQLTGPDTDPVNLFNLVVQEFVQKEAGNFLDQMKSWKYDPNMPTNMSTFASGYSVYTANEKLISLKLQYGTYMAGAAHPYSYVRTVNYDLAAGELIPLKDLFRPQVDYLALLSDFSRQELSTHGIDPLFEEGFQAKEENFRSWGLTKDGLILEFDPYQVDAYAAGPQQVLIPYTKIQDVMAEGLPAKYLDAPEIPVEAGEVTPPWPTPVPTP
jgi:hypothetical protein